MIRNDQSARSAATLPPLDNLQQQRALEHLALAQRLAWKHFQSCSRTVPLDELRGEALYALVYAAGMFDDARGVPFGAYATMAISHRLIQAMNAWRRGGRQAYTRFTDLTATTQTEFDTPCPRTRESRDQAALREAMDRLRRLLPPRWFHALHLYYAQGHTLEEVGQRLGVTRERVRQLLTKAVDRARGGAAA
jgi:RNA polymerase primary sigma factor